MKRIDITEVAKMVRTILKEAFPTHKFSVTSDRYATGCSIDISWTDGPTKEQVARLTQILEGKRFDGTTDSSSYVRHVINGEEVSLGVDFIMCHRSFTKAAHGISLLEDRGSPTATTIILTNPFLTEEKISA